MPNRERLADASLLFLEAVQNLTAQRSFSKTYERLRDRSLRIMQARPHIVIVPFVKRRNAVRVTALSGPSGLNRSRIVKPI